MENRPVNQVSVTREERRNEPNQGQRCDMDHQSEAFRGDVVPNLNDNEQYVNVERPEHIESFSPERQ